MAGIKTAGGCSSQGDMESLPAGLKVDAVLLLDAQLAIKQLWRLPELLMPGGVVVLCSSTSCAGDSSEMKVRQFWCYCPHKCKVFSRVQPQNGAL